MRHSSYHYGRTTEGRGDDGDRTRVRRRNSTEGADRATMLSTTTTPLSAGMMMYNMNDNSTNTTGGNHHHITTIADHEIQIRASQRLNQIKDEHTHKVIVEQKMKDLLSNKLEVLRSYVHDHIEADNWKYESRK